MSVQIIVMLFIVIAAVIVVHRNVKSHMSFRRLMEVKEYEFKNRNNHRLTFHCICDECIKQDSPENISETV